MRCLADFVLDSDLRFPDGSDASTIMGPNDSFELTLSNMETGHEEPDSVLSAQLVFDTESLHDAREESFAYLVQALNSLSYTTNRKFSLTALKRLIDWTPGIVEREAIVFVETPEWDVAEPALSSPFLKTAERLLAMQSGDEQQSAMRWYRLGLQAEAVDEQFSYLWFALEIASEAQKGNEKVPSKCPICQGALYCERCGKHPTHRRYAGEAIRQMIERVHPNNADEIFTTLQRIRHTLMHGGRIATVIDELPCDEEQAINKLAYVTWNAIGLMFSKPDPQEHEALSFGYVENLVRRTLVAGVHVKTTLKEGSDADNPKLADFPSIQFEVTKSLDGPAGLVNNSEAAKNS